MLVFAPDSGAAYDANGNRVITRDANGLGEDCEFDNLNRNIECADIQEQADNTARTKTYNAHNAVLISTNAEGHTTENTYDERDRLAASEDANLLVTTYGYDENGNLLTLTDPKNATRSWTYDERNLKVTKVMPDANDTVLYSHDALRRLKVVTQQDNSTIEMHYDLAGRMTSREYSDSTTDTFGYDAASRLVTATKGRHAITVNRSYYDDGAMASESYVLDGRTYTLERGYDARNLVATQTFADGKVMEWFHDSRRLVTDAEYDGDLVLEQDFDAGSRLVQQAFGNDLVRDITFGRPDNMRTGDTVSDTGVIDELSFTYGYAPDKNVMAETQINGALENLSFNAVYDAGNRVTSYNRAAAYPGARENQSWNYDGAGNWDSTVIDGDTQSRTHSASDQLEVIEGDNLTYDPRGNQLTDNRDNEYLWDLDNRIIEADGSGYSKIEYRYDALGRRIVRDQSNNQEVLLWWGNTEQSEHKHQAGQTTIQNDLQANPSEAALNTVFARALEGDKLDIQYFHKNYLDHVMAVSDDNGNLIEHYRYTAFGEPEIYGPTGTKLAATAIDNDILWNVRRYEAANGLYLYLYRDYDAASGRWPSRDPIGERGGGNLYGFVGNNGVNSWDYLGMEAHLFFVPADENETRNLEKGWVFQSNEKAKSALTSHLIQQALRDFSKWIIKIHIAVDENGVISRSPSGEQGLVPIFNEIDIHNYSDELINKILLNEQQSTVKVMPFKKGSGLDELREALGDFVSGDPNYSYDFFTLTAHGDREGKVSIGGSLMEPQPIINAYKNAASNYRNVNHSICGVSSVGATCVTEFIPFDITYDYNKCTINITPAQSGAGGFEPFPPAK